MCYGIVSRVGSDVSSFSHARNEFHITILEREIRAKVKALKCRWNEVSGRGEQVAEKCTRKREK